MGCLDGQFWRSDGCRINAKGTAMPCEVTAHLARVLAATSIEDIWAMHCKKMAEYGFDRLLYGFTRFRTRDSFGHADDILVLSNHDQDYFDAFIKSGLFNDAPMVRWAAANVGACSWRRIEEMLASHDLTESDRRIIEINHAHGVRAGYSISFPDTSVRAKGAIGLCAPDGTRQHQVEDIWEKHGIIGVEMESQILFTVAKRLGAKALSILTVSDNIVTGEASDAKDREQSYMDMMKIALELA